MNKALEIAESAAEQAERYQQTAKRGGILQAPAVMLALTCGVPAALAVARVDAWVIALATVPVLTVLVFTAWIVRAAVQQKQMVLLAGEKVIIEAMRSGILGTREHTLSEGARPEAKALDQLRERLEQVPVDHGRTHLHALEGSYTTQASPVEDR